VPLKKSESITFVLSKALSNVLLRSCRTAHFSSTLNALLISVGETNVVPDKKKSLMPHRGWIWLFLLLSL